MPGGVSENLIQQVIGSRSGVCTGLWNHW